MTLPEPFIDQIKPYLPADELAEFTAALSDTEPSTCLRLNPHKPATLDLPAAQPIGWNAVCGRYLAERPNFTLDPLMHAGCYYVQEAASQFITHVVRQLVHRPVSALDLCAAPGGKSTALLSALPEGSTLVSNEIDRRRARILAENVTKWGHPNVIVTCNAPADFTHLPHQFDLILTDVPCSGEGMFRKDEGAVADWSPQKVAGCVALQRQILADIWPRLRPGGWLIYSTCTFNVHEDEEMLAYLCDELGAEALSVPTDPAWQIHAPLTGTLPCYRFMPHRTTGEGLFMAVVRKPADAGEQTTSASYDTESDSPRAGRREKKGKQARPVAKAPVVDLKRLAPQLLSQISLSAEIEATAEGTLRAIPTLLLPLHRAIVSHGLYVLQSGIEMGTLKGKDIIPAHALALSTVRAASAFPTADLDLPTALNYLRHEAIVLPADVPTGYVLVTYHGQALGFVKNLGNRCNTLYPQEWRIRYL